MTGLVGIYSDPHHIIEYADGEVRQQFSVCFSARIAGGTLARSDESIEVAFVPPSELGALEMHDSIRLRVQHYLEQRPAPYLG